MVFSRATESALKMMLSIYVEEGSRVKRLSMERLGLMLVDTALLMT